MKRTTPAWRIRGSVIALLAATGIALAACTGSDGPSRADLDAAEARAKAAEEAQRQAELDKARAEAAAEEARRQREAAEQEKLREEQAREAAEAEQKRLKDEAEEAQDALNREQAQDALAQLKQTLTTFPGTVTPKYNAKASVTGMPRKLTKSVGSKADSWYVTRLGTSNNQRDETVVVYSDVGPSTRELLSEAHASAFSPVDGTNLLQATISNDRDQTLIASSSFPRLAKTSDPFKPTIDSDPATDGSDNDGNTKNDYDTVKVPGSYDGASGNFYCLGTDCTVTHLGGGNYTMAGGAGWTFQVSKTAKVSVPDKTYSHFGWWKYHNLATDAFTFSTFTGGMGSTPPDLFSSLTGEYTYKGTASGHYALYSGIAAAESGTGEFTANATLTAIFGATDTISGSITGISGKPGWSLELEETSIEGTGAFNNASDGVEWTIGGAPKTGGNWAGQFYFDNNAKGAVPTAAVGTFTGEYGTEGRIIGAFGAHN